MSNDFLKAFVALAGAALEAEDRFILGAGSIHGQPGGLLRSPLEKFYQFIVWKAAYSRWPADVEKSYHDLVILDTSESTKFRCVFEMKNWFSPNGRKEIPWMMADVEGKLKSCNADDSALIVFSANDRGCMHEQLRWFEEHVFSGISQPLRETYCFPTSSPWTPTECEFWIAVWPIKAGPLFSQQ